MQPSSSTGEPTLCEPPPQPTPCDLSQVEVFDHARGSTTFFDARCWLDARAEDGGAERRLTASAADPRASGALVAYQVQRRT